MKIVLSLVLLFGLVVSPVLAQVTSDGFGIHVAGPGDTEAPSTPTLLSVTPITHTQIDITWSAATDNALVSGYSILRDGVPIATTSLLSYADTGLIASTTYNYAVRAFDPSLNYSSTSNSLATTTLQPPLEIPSSQPTQATAARVVLDAFQIALGISTTTFFLETAHQARLEVRWGRTASYELGYVVSNIFTKKHVVPITDLEPGTTYEYEIVGYTPAGFPTVLKQGEFTTTDVALVTAPPNVNYFRAVGIGNDVALSWQLPVKPIMQVRVVRSHFSFPEHPQDGAVIYQGLEAEARDEGILAQYSPVYYTAFVYDNAGNVSSGAVAVVYRTGSGEVNELPEKPTGSGERGVIVDSVEAATSTVVKERVTVDMKLPNLSDLELQQNGKTVHFNEVHITLDPTQGFLISIPRLAVSGNLKSIIASVGDENNSQGISSFLLRINKDRTAYEAHVAPLVAAGKTSVVVEIYDYEAYVIGTYQTPVTFLVTAPIEEELVLFPDMLFHHRPYIVGAVVGVGGLLLSLWWLVFRRRQGEDNN